MAQAAWRRRVGAPGDGVAVALVALVCTLGRTAHALEAEVRAETTGQAYQLSGPAGSPVVTSLRVSQSISADAVGRPTGPDDVSWSFRLRVRFDADFGDACDPVTGHCLDETNRANRGEFAPLFDQRAMDIPLAYLDIHNLFRRLDLRLGRMLVIDALGFFLFDGARARVRLGHIAVIEAIGGLEVRSGFLVSNGRFERDGLIRADRSGWDPSVAPYVLDHTFAPVVGFAIETTPMAGLFARLSYRTVWTDQGISEEKIGGSIDGTAGPLRLHGDAVYSIPQQLLSHLGLSAALHAPRGPGIALELVRDRPTFDLSSIWASFWIDPIDEARVHAALPFAQHFSLDGAWYVRRYALSESGAAPGSVAPVRDEWNTGGYGSLHYLRPSWSGTLRAQLEGGDIGARAGVDTDGQYWLIPGLMRLDARLSLWHIVDELRPQRSGFSFGVLAGATLRLGRIADLHTDVEDDINRLVGQRFRVMAVLSLRGAL